MQTCCVCFIVTFSIGLCLLQNESNGHSSDPCYTRRVKLKTHPIFWMIRQMAVGIYILPTAPMPTEKLITYLPTCDNTILYVMITLVSINFMILLYKFLTRKLQHSTIAFELSTGHDVSHFLWLNFLCVPRCIITWHVRIFHTGKLKVGLDLVCYCGKEVKLLLWISWTILSCKFLRKPLSQYGKESN